MTRPKLSIIDNEGQNHLLDALRTLCETASALELEVAFVTSSGVKKLLPSLRKVAARGGVRILTGLYQSITEPAALRALIKVQRQTKGKLTVKLARERDFHRKMYLARTKGTLQVIVGSSNLTMGGLISGGEINLRIGIPVTSPQALRLSKIFKSDWKKGFELTLDRIQRYEAKAKRPKQALLSTTTLAQILGGQTEHVKGVDDDDKQPSRYWCDGVDGGVSKEVAASVYEQTGWDKKGYSWSGLRTSVYEDDDCILFIDRTSKPGWAYLVRVRGQTEVETKSDGRYFVAHTTLPKTKRRMLTKAFLQELKVLGIKQPGRVRAKLSDKKWIEATRLFSK